MAIKLLFYLFGLIILLVEKPNSSFAVSETSLAIQQSNQVMFELDKNLRIRRSASAQDSSLPCPNGTGSFECHEVCNGINDCTNGFDESLELAEELYGSNATCKDCLLYTSPSPRDRG